MVICPRGLCSFHLILLSSECLGLIDCVIPSSLSRRSQSDCQCFVRFSSLFLRFLSVFFENHLSCRLELDMTRLLPNGCLDCYSDQPTTHIASDSSGSNQCAGPHDPRAI